MAAQPLSAQNKLILDLADRTQLVNAFSAMPLPQGAGWFAAAHAGMHGIEKDHKPNGPSAISSQSLAEYLAVATPTHCADGWSYLSRALHSYLVGDPHSAWHFAYYAELRAAQSILSGLGCGAFNSWNCVLDAAGQLHQLEGRSPTHEMVWLALHHLAENSVNSGETIASATSFFGDTLPEIVQYAYPGRQPTATSANWICDWLFDLETGASDKGFRNRCSYNPHIATPHRSQLSECVELMATFWEALEPSPRAAFLELDKQMLRSVLKKEGIDSLTLRSGGIPPNAIEIEAEMRAAYQRILASAPTFSAIPEAFMTNSAANEHPLILHARNYSNAPDTPRPILARATLLLRIASGVSQNLLADSGQTANLDFWLNELAEQQGVVPDRSEIPANRSELYFDCAYAAEDMEKAFQSGATSLAALANHKNVKPHLVSQAERVVQWGLAL
jgi:hypothetical protein